jgi:single-strand selective monofunctional uracil DNA glycosylase
MPTVDEYAAQFHYSNNTSHMMNNPPPPQPQPIDLAEQLMAIEEKLADDLMKLTYEFPVENVYNPIKHAKELHLNFLKRYYTEGPKPILFLGMNPGPWGMVQTGKFSLFLY